MPNTTSFEFGAVVLIRFPFTDQTASKQRPAVVVSSRAYNEQRPDVIVMAPQSGAASGARHLFRQATQLDRILRQEKLSTSDRSTAERVLRDLRDALKAVE